MCTRAIFNGDNTILSCKLLKGKGKCDCPIDGFQRAARANYLRESFDERGIQLNISFPVHGSILFIYLTCAGYL